MSPVHVVSSIPDSCRQRSLEVLLSRGWLWARVCCKLLCPIPCHAPSTVLSFKGPFAGRRQSCSKWLCRPSSTCTCWQAGFSELLALGPGLPCPSSVSVLVQSVPEPPIAPSARSGAAGSAAPLAALPLASDMRRDLCLGQPSRHEEGSQGKTLLEVAKPTFGSHARALAPGPDLAVAVAAASYFTAP